MKNTHTSQGLNWFNFIDILQIIFYKFYLKQIKAYKSIKTLIIKYILAMRCFHFWSRAFKISNENVSKWISTEKKRKEKS